MENCPPGGFIFQKQHSHIPELDTAEMCHQSLAPVEADEQPDRPDLIEQIFQTNVSSGDFLKLVVQGMEHLHVSRRKGNK